MLSLNRVSKSYPAPGGPERVVDDVTLTVEAGAVHGIIGPSGAGKSTLLRLVNLLEQPDEGTVTVAGEELTLLGDRALREARRGIGMIFQQYNLVANRSVLGNVMLPMELAGGMSTRERRERAEECLHFVGLTDKADQYPARLSGGQRQRVAIARALANRPRLLLCDEPTSALDPGTTAEILQVLRHANESLGITVVLVTHEMDVVRAVCSHVSVMEGGRITDSFSRQKTPFRPPAGYGGSYREQIIAGTGETDV